VVVLESAVALCLIVTLASVIALLRARAELYEARAKSAVLETVPLEWFRWRPGGTNADAHDKAPGYRPFLASLSAADAERLEKARHALQSRAPLSRPLSLPAAGPPMPSKDGAPRAATLCCGSSMLRPR
jgi:hypothetical protein